MAVEIASAYVSLSYRADEFVKNLRADIQKQVGAAGDDAGDAAGKGFLSKFSTHAGKLGGVVTTALKGAAVVGGAAALGGGLFLKDAITNASDLGETISKTGVLLPTLAEDAIAWAKDAALAQGLSQRAALDALTAQANLLQAQGVTEQQSFESSKALIGRAGDVASFMNATAQEVNEAIVSGLSGESEPLKRFGVFITEERLKAEALSLGLIKAEVDTLKLSRAQETLDKAQRKATEAQKKHGEGSVEYSDAVRDVEQANAALADVTAGKLPAAIDKATRAQALQSLFMKDTAASQGDFLETQESVANRQRQISALWENLSATIGQAFLPAVAAAMGFVVTTAIPALERLGDRVGPLVESIGRELSAAFESARPVVAEFIDRLRPIGGFLADLVGRLADVDWRGVFAGAVEFMRPIVGFAGQIIEAVAGIVARLREVDWQAVFGRAAEIIGPIARGLNELKDAVLAAATQALPPLLKAFDFLAFTVLPPVLDVVTKIAAVVADVLGVALQVLAPIVGVLGDNMNILVPALLAAAGAFVAFKTATAVVGGVQTATSAISTLKGVADTFGVSFSKAALEAGKQTNFGTAVTSKFDALKTSITGAKTQVVSLAKAGFSKIKAGFTSIATSAKAAATALLGYIKAAIAWVKQAVITTAAAVKQAAVWVAQKVSMIATTVATHAYTAAQWLLNAAMNANPIGLVIAGLVALGAGLVLAYQKSETFRAIVDAIGRFFRDVLWPAIVDVAKAVGGFFVDAFHAVTGALSALWPIVVQVAEFIGNVFVSYVRTYIDVLRTAVGIVFDVGKAVGGFFADAFNVARDAIDRVWPVIETVARFIGGVLKGQIDVAVTAVRNVINWFAWLIDAAGNVYNGVKGWFDSLVGFLSGLPGTVSSAVSGLFDGIKDAFRSAINWVITRWNGLEFSLPKIDAGPLGSFGGFSIGTPYINPLADGGVITRPTLALMGEVGRARPEIVTPERLMRSVVADELSRAKPTHIEQHFHNANVDAQEVSRALAWTLRTGG